MTSVSTRTDEAGADATDGERRASPASVESDENAGRREADAGHGRPAPAAPDDSGRGGSDGSTTGRTATMRTRLVESTVVAAVTGVCVVLGGSTAIAPDLSLTVALAGVLWLFVRTLPPMRRRREGGTRTSEDGTYSRDGAATLAESASDDSHPDETPVSTDQRLKLEVADHGGRMMQKELVEAVDLSESAVSRRLSRLETEDDEVGRVCLGRENMVYLAGNRPDGADSPFGTDDGE